MKRFRNMCLSHRTLCRGIDDFTNSVKKITEMNINNSVVYSGTLHNSCDVTDTAQLITSIPGVKENLKMN